MRIDDFSMKAIYQFFVSKKLLYGLQGHVLSRYSKVPNNGTRTFYVFNPIFHPVIHLLETYLLIESNKRTASTVFSHMQYDY